MLCLYVRESVMHVFYVLYVYYVRYAMRVCCACKIQLQLTHVCKVCMYVCNVGMLSYVMYVCCVLFECCVMYEYDVYVCRLCV